MAQPYQLPGEFRTPDMSQAILSSNQNLQAAANVDEGTRQFTAFTNILNANRDQSLRERQFAQQMLNADREYQLAKNAQEYNFQMGNKEFDLKKNYQDVLTRTAGVQADTAMFNLEQSKYLINQQREAQSKAPELLKALEDGLGPQRGYTPDALQKIVEIKSQIATNPALAQQFDMVAAPFLAQANTYAQNNTQLLLAQANGALMSGKLDKILVDDPDNPGQQVNGRWLLYQAQKANQNGDYIGTQAALSALKDGMDIYSAQRQAEIEQAAITRASTFGLPPEEFTVEKGQVKAKFGLPSTYYRGAGGVGGAGGTGATGGGGARPVTSEMTNPLKDFENKLETAKSELDKATEALKEVSNAPGSPEAAKRNQDYQEALGRFNTAKALRDSQEQAILIQNEAVGTARPTTTRPIPQYGVPFEMQPATPVAPSAPAIPAQTLQPTSARALFTPMPAPTIQNVIAPAKPQAEAQPTATPTNVFAPESLLSPEAQVVLGAGRTIGRTAGSAATSFAQNIPVVGPATRAVETAIPVAKGAYKVAKVGKAVAKELLSYEDFLSKTEAAARARASQGEDYQTALQDEQKKLFEEIKTRRSPGTISTL